jgi:hypothetical protein
MTSLVPDSEPVEAKQSDKVKYLAAGRKRIRTGMLHGVSECGRFVKIHKLERNHWISIKDVKAICKGKLKLIPN